MSRTLPNDRLIRVSKVRQQVIANWKEGVSIENDAGCSIAQIICLVAADRWRLAYEHKRHANKLLQLKPSVYRSAISRYYYAMYHAMRACAYIFHEGDDYEEHSKLPLHIPADFPPGMDWQSVLKNARLIRNRADYDPYPKPDRSWRVDAMSIKADADLLLFSSRKYLLSRGCTI